MVSFVDGNLPIHQHRQQPIAQFRLHVWNYDFSD
jgi:hypothetical protein